MTIRNPPDRSMMMRHPPNDSPIFSQLSVSCMLEAKPLIVSIGRHNQLIL